MPSINLKPLENGAKFVGDMVAPVDLNGARPTNSWLETDIRDLQYMLDHGNPFSLSDIPAFTDALMNMDGVGIDDSKFLLEKLLTIMARLPKDSPTAAKLQQFVIGLLYKDLPHPPSGYLAVPQGQTPPLLQADSAAQHPVTYAFRSADGSNYNPLTPNMGKARSPYARSVPSLKCLSPAGLPDANLVFDTLLKRDKFVPHQGGISSLFFAFADLVIHSIFNTNTQDWTQNDASSYLDLSPLYGSSQADVDRIRRKDGTGRLWDDVFADSRLLMMPPSVCALLVLLSRNHNFIAEKILSINERGTFTTPPPADEAKRRAQDEEIFQRARLVNAGFFMQIILGDYVGAILGLVRDGNSWRLDPMMNMRDANHEVTPRGEGNVVSIEFNLLYRWHATLSEHDTAWTEQIFTNKFQGADYKTISVQEFAMAARKAMKPDPDVRKWTFSNLTRDANGRFSNADLAKILQDATEAPASAFKARGTPEVLRVIELLSIEQARTWGTCSLNEFRSFMGLKPYGTFREWNPDPEIYTAAESLYHHIDNLELHVGLQAEKTKEPMPGAGLCPGFTISRAILADAVCLTRGDRFLSVDFTPFNLTNWGYQDCQVNDNDGSYGGMLTKLLFRHLPEYYPPGSAYVHFPFMVPDAMKTFAAELPHNVVAKYAWSRPEVPVGANVVVKSFAEAKHVATDEKQFESDAGAKVALLLGPVDTSVGPTVVTPVTPITPGGWALVVSSQVENALFAEAQVDKAVKSMADITSSLIAAKAIKGVGSSTKYVDVVKDVLNLLPVLWLANDIVGLPIKSDANPRGIFREQELLGMFKDISNFIYFDMDPVNEWTLHDRAVDVSKTILESVRNHISRINGGITGALKDRIDHTIWDRSDHSDAFLKVLSSAERGSTKADGLAASLIAEVVPTAPIFSKALIHVVNYFLDDARLAQRSQIVKHTADGSLDGDKAVMDLVYEALRNDPPISSIRRTAASSTTVGGQKVAEGQAVYASLIEANLDSLRPASTDGVFGFDQKGLLNARLFDRVTPRILHTIFSLKNLGRANMQSGRLNRFTQTVGGIPQQMYVDINGVITPFPTSMVVQFNDA